MRAWTVDADDIQIADDLDAALLHRTSWIESFLEQKRSDQFIVTATKGFGKTHGAAIATAGARHLARSAKTPR